MAEGTVGPWSGSRELQLLEKRDLDICSLFWAYPRTCDEALAVSGNNAVHIEHRNRECMQNKEAANVGCCVHTLLINYLRALLTTCA